MSATPRIAVYGCGIVNRLAKYVEQQTVPLPGNMMFFDGYCYKVISHALEFQPDVVVVVVGGGDELASESSVKMSHEIVRVVRRFQQAGVKDVWVVDILPRGLCGRARILKKEIPDSYLGTPLSYPRDYEPRDLQFPSEEGITRLLHNISCVGAEGVCSTCRIIGTLCGELCLICGNGLMVDIFDEEETTSSTACRL